MVKAIRQAGLKLVVVLLRWLGRPAAPGWRRSPRGTSLRGR